MFDFFGLLGSNKNTATTTNMPKANTQPLDSNLEYVGPYSPEAYNAASIINSGGQGTPYTSNIIDAGRKILDSQPQGGDSGGGTSKQIAAEKAAAEKAAADAQRRRELGLHEAQLGGARTEFDTAKANTQSRLQQILDRYLAETTKNEGIFSTQSDVNASNYNRNLQEAMINAARGRQGLAGTLAALGALSGSGVQLMDQAVQQGANLDIAGADQTFRDNQSGLVRAIEEYRDQDKVRTEEARNQAAALNQQAENNYLKTQQEIFVKMANLYNALGDSAQADKYTRQASDLATRIGATGVSPVGSLTATAANFSPEALGSYVGGLNDVSVTQGSPNPGSLVPTLLASIRRREQGV